MRFNSLRQLGGPEAHELKNSIMGAFYARYPEVQKAVNYDSASFGELTEKTKAMVRKALDRDAAMHSALDNIACDPHKRCNPQVFHNEWEEFSHQLVGYAREALGMPPLVSSQESRSQS